MAPNCRVDQDSLEKHKTMQMNFYRRLAARGYYVSLSYRFIQPAFLGPSQNRACATNAHGSSSVYSLRSKQVHRDTRFRQWKLLQEFTEFLPGHTSPLPSSIKPQVEQHPRLVGESPDSPRVITHPVVCVVSPQFRDDRPHQLGSGQRAVLLQPLFEYSQLGLELLSRGYALHPEAPTEPRLATEMRQPQKVKCLGSLAPRRGFRRSQWAKLHDLGLLGRHFESELGKSSVQFCPTPLRIALALKADHESSRAGESHPHALSEPDVRLSPHLAPTCPCQTVS